MLQCSIQGPPACSAELHPAFRPQPRDMQRTVLLAPVLHIDAADEPVAFQNRKDVIAILPFVRRYKNFNPVI